MSECVNSVEREIIFLTVFFQPAVGRLRIHRTFVPLNEQSIALYPLCLEPAFLDGLLRSEPPQQVHYYLEQLRYTLGAPRLGGIRVDTLLRGVLRDTSDVDEVIFKVDILPLKSSISLRRNPLYIASMRYS